MSKPKTREELLYELKYWFAGCGDRQAYNQIKTLIQNQPESKLILKDHDKMTEHELRTEVLRLKAKLNKIENKPEVDEEFVEKWVEKLGIKVRQRWSDDYYVNPSKENLKQMLQEASYNVVKKPEITLNRKESPPEYVAVEIYPEITMKDIEGWADEIWDRIDNHKDRSYLADGMKEMVEEEFGIKVKK